MDPKLTTTLSSEANLFGFRRIFLNRYSLAAVVVALFLAAVVAPGTTEQLGQLLALHSTLLGFNLTVFGLIILGGLDALFDRAMKNRGESALIGARKLAFNLFWPVLIQLACTVTVLTRIGLNHSLIDFHWLRVLWRLCYAYLLLFGLYEQAFAARRLFLTAVMRLKFRGKARNDRPKLKMRVTNRPVKMLRQSR